MSRLIFLFAVAALVYLLIKSYRKKLPENPKTLEENMVCCAHCGVYLPVGEGIRAGEQVFCCVAHRDAAQK